MLPEAEKNENNSFTLKVPFARQYLALSFDWTNGLQIKLD